jgi:uncharacterized protein YlzI (FlbEa/FlbD family)
MIKLTRLNGEEFVINAELIQCVESRPDTFITLTSADRLFKGHSSCSRPLINGFTD